MSHVNQTFSLTKDISLALDFFVKKREKSKFVAEAIRKSLEQKKRELEEEYLQANKDEDQCNAIIEWRSTQNDGSYDWEW